MALMFTYNLAQKKNTSVYHRTPVFLPVCNTTADLQKAEQTIADSMLFRQEALLHQCKARRIAQSTFGVWEGSALGASPFSPATAIPRAYLGTSPAGGFYHREGAGHVSPGSEF
jgi:hypothetical protein